MKLADRLNYYKAPVKIHPRKNVYKIWVCLDECFTDNNFTSKKEAIEMLRSRYIGGVVYGPSGRPIYSR